MEGKEEMFKTIAIYELRLECFAFLEVVSFQCVLFLEETEISSQYAQCLLPYKQNVSGCKKAFTT
jgi:hypothetical protein